MTEPAVAQKIREFFSQYPSRMYRKGDVLIDSGEEQKRIYYLESGHVRQYMNTQEGEEIVFNMYKSGAFFPMAWVNDTFVNTHSFQAMDDVFVRIAPYESVLVFVKQQPDILFDLLKRVYRGLEGLLSQIEQLMTGNASDRIKNTLAILEKRHIKLKLTHQDFAALTGLTRETVSREIKKLQKQGTVV